MSKADDMREHKADEKIKAEAWVMSHGNVPGDDDGAPEDGAYVVENSPEAICPEGQLWFDGRCAPKKTVKQAIEIKDEKALVKAQGTDARAVSEATTELIEQQIVQARKSETDLDEIISILEERQDKGTETKTPEGPQPEGPQP
jgi:hypothetical protein